MTENFDAILRKVAGLLANADDPANPPEAQDAYRRKAEGLMFKYRIDSAMAAVHGQGRAEDLKPVWSEILVTSADSEYANYYSGFASICAKHVGARSVVTYGWVDGQYGIVLKAVGFDSDLQYMNLLLTSMVMEFGARLEPKEDKNLSFDENAYAMRMAGMERRRIAAILLGPWDSENEMKAKNRKVTNAVKREAERRGEDASIVLGRGNSVKTYRESFASGFYSTMSYRLQRMRIAVGEDSTALVLAGRQEAVDEAFYAEYPHKRPQPSSTPRIGEEADSRANCDKCKKAKSGYCRSHNWMRPRAYRAGAFNHDAYGRGGAAATAVDLGPGAAGKTRMRTGTSRTALEG